MGLLDVLGGSRSRSRGMSPLTMALLGVLAYRTIKGKGRLADILGDGSPGRCGLGGLLAGAGAGGVVAGGLSDLLDRFRQAGHSDKAQSWIDIGPNKPIAPHALERALGEERIQWLMTETGMGRDELLTGLSGELPSVVDSLTPKGRIPAEDELDKI